jgi:TrmH family RNA methyltransferase
MHITSSQNPRIKSLMRLKANSRERLREGVVVVEGHAEIDLALSAGHVPRLVLSSPDLARAPLRPVQAETITVSSSIFEKLSAREHPDGWLALFDRPRRALESLEIGPLALLLVLESLEKPGNLGAILRTADAASVDAVLVCDGRADIYGPNVVRASRGTLLTVPLFETGTAEAAAFLDQRGVEIAAAMPDDGEEYTRVRLHGPLAIAVGSEDRGLSTTWVDNATFRLRIPMTGKVNSLNVSVATALLVYEVLRQRAAA